MNTLTARKAQAMTRIDRPLAEELADWFEKQSEKDVISNDLIADKIADLRVTRGLPLWGKKGEEIPRNIFHHIINDTRHYMIAKHRLTLKCSHRSTSRDFEGGYKVATEQEATQIGEARFKRWGLYGNLCMEILPLMKKKYLGRSVRQMWVDTLQMITEVKQNTEKYLIAYDTDEKIREKERKQITVEPK